MKKTKLLLFLLVSIPLFSQTGTYNFTRLIDSSIQVHAIETKSTLIFFGSPNYGDIKLTTSKGEDYFESTGFIDDFKNNRSESNLLYYTLINKKTKERVYLKFYYEGTNPIAIFIFCNGKEMIYMKEI
jgi:hypothetical protein